MPNPMQCLFFELCCNEGSLSVSWQQGTHSALWGTHFCSHTDPSVRSEGCTGPVFGLSSVILFLLPLFPAAILFAGVGGGGGTEDRKRNNGMGKHRTDFRRQQSECAPPAAAASLGGKVTLMAALSGCHGHRTARNIVLWV